MQLHVDATSVVVFDLDDTLYKEIDFVRSGYSAVLLEAGVTDSGALEQMMRWQRAGEPALDRLLDSLARDPGSLGLLSPPDRQPQPDVLLDRYRHHDPVISLEAGALELLHDIRAASGELAIITDGRSRTQRAKVAALGLRELVEVVVVSEEIGSTKPSAANFLRVVEAFPDRTAFTYVADNPAKDFKAPNELGWLTVQVEDDGRNIHKQNAGPEPGHAPQVRVADLSRIRVT